MTAMSGAGKAEEEVSATGEIDLPWKIIFIRRIPRKQCRIRKECLYF
jgi:hypothetical protein